MEQSVGVSETASVVDDVMLEALRCLLEKRQVERSAADVDIAQIERLIAQLGDGKPWGGVADAGGDRRRLDAVRVWAREVRRPFTTREALDAAERAGVRGGGNKPMATMYATLRNAPREFRRTPDGKMWEFVTGN